MSWMPRDNNAAELGAFQDTCQRLSGFDERCSFEWVDGFLTGLAAGPHVPDAQTWLWAMCEDSFERTFADPADHLRALRTLKARLSVLVDQLDPEALLNDPNGLRLNPLMVEWTDPAGESVLAEDNLDAAPTELAENGVVWADGFITAVEAFQAELVAQKGGVFGAARHVMLVAQISALMLEPDGPTMQQHLKIYFPHRDAPVRGELIETAIVAAQELRLWWVEQAPKPSTRLVEKRPGRNEPCHCGSGKKFKKCHGA